MATNFQQIIPMLSYEDGVKAMQWLCDIFGFTEQTRWLDDNGKLTHGEIAMGDSIIMLAQPTPEYEGPNRHRQNCAQADKWLQVPYIINGVLVYVDDVDAHFAKAKAGGAIILSEIEEGGPGKRYRAADPEGQRWMFMQKP